MSLFVRAFNSSALAPPQEFSPLPGHWLASTRPLDLEIGCGVGWHPIRYCKANPDRRLIAIEQTSQKFARFESRVNRQEPLENLIPVHADAIRWVTHQLSAKSLDRCLILYPNPEPKSPNQRWLRRPFMHRLIDVLKPGGEIILATNESWYFEEAHHWAKEYRKFEVLGAKAFALGEVPGDGLPRTHFEKKYLNRGERCFQLTLKKALK